MRHHTKCPTFMIEYDKRNHRAIKVFTDYYEGRRFYIAKHNAGKNPKIINPAKRMKATS